MFIVLECLHMRLVMLEHKLWMGRHVCFVSCSTNSLDPYLEYSKYSINIY